MKINEDDIRQIVYSMISEIRYRNREDYITALHEDKVKDARSLSEASSKYEYQEKRLIYKQAIFEDWLQGQSRLLDEIEKKMREK